MLCAHMDEVGIIVTRITSRLSLAPMSIYRLSVLGTFFRSSRLTRWTAVMLKLLEEDLPLDVTFTFTAQEEVGTRGAAGAGSLSIFSKSATLPTLAGA